MGGSLSGADDAPHGQKRRAEEELANDQRLIKRFHLLNLERNGKLYIPIDQNGAGHRPQIQAHEDTMRLDDTKDKVYIYNLDEELRGVDEEEEKLIFLPDIDRKFAKIPKSVLTSQSKPLGNQEMVLYNVPSSLTVPAEEDNVRKAIMETRERARQRQTEEAKAAESSRGTESMITNGDLEETHSARIEYTAPDDDAMEIG